MAAQGAAKAKPMTKTEIHTALAEATGLSKKEIGGVLEELGNLIGENVGKKGPGVFNLPGLLKVTVVRKPATPAKKGVPNPFKPGELMDVAAKPARNVVKVRPLKALKDMA
ncbi:MAG: DNA-binding protein [Planctomycetaceae bacterium]|jgi:nucleoid DNA-binding protein|nr:DNA-binding protein [Planctomycetaceae bacterium]MBT6156458.1 DNA-binding protein [Planctomycetaceae bacterium]MBT6485464.1 DNA-binding protein [Planctomycetaceae bacterium]MBT6497260.1 DNA-binding protein [Planctomycetaceae bacterium]